MFIYASVCDHCIMLYNPVRRVTKEAKRHRRKTTGQLFGRHKTRTVSDQGNSVELGANHQKHSGPRYRR